MLFSVQGIVIRAQLRYISRRQVHRYRFRWQESDRLRGHVLNDETATKPNVPTTERIHQTRATLHSVGVHNSYTILTRETFVALVLVIVVIVTLGEEERVRARKRTSRTNRSKKKREKKRKRILSIKNHDRIAQQRSRDFFVKHRRRVFKIFRIERDLKYYSWQAANRLIISF